MHTESDHPGTAPLSLDERLHAAEERTLDCLRGSRDTLEKARVALRRAQPQVGSVQLTRPTKKEPWALVCVPLRYPTGLPLQGRGFSG
jgi:hypothetical protein